MPERESVQVVDLMSVCSLWSLDAGRAVAFVDPNLVQDEVITMLTWRAGFATKIVSNLDIEYCSR